MNINDCYNFDDFRKLAKNSENQNQNSNEIQNFFEDDDPLEITIPTGNPAWGGAYTIYMSASQNQIIVEKTINTNKIPSYYILPQIFLLACADALIVTSSFEHAYQNTRISIQSISMAIVISMLTWGNLIRLIISF